jgi:hypothetical protein
MGDSWGHALEQLSIQELFRLARNDAWYEARYGDLGYRRQGMCASGRVKTHREPATYVSSYNYATGRAGRVSWASRLLCADHAAKFAAKHGLDFVTVPVQVARPKHASEQAFEQFFGSGSA